VTEARRGRLIALEGIDGCGKSTQAQRLSERLGAVLTFEPGATRLGMALRRLLLDRHQPPVSERSEALLMAADRAQHLAEVVVPALDSGTWVVSDRYSASTLAYQGFGRGLDRSELGQLVRWATGGLQADLTVLVEVPLAVASDRRTGTAGDRFEVEGDAFLQRVADGYRCLAAESATPWLVVDGTGSEAEVAEAVWLGVDDRLGPLPGAGEAPEGRPKAGG
jgi:dTMP kinase